MERILENYMKLKAEELQALKTIKEQTNFLVREFGSIFLMELELEERKKQAKKNWKALIKEERKVLSYLEETYGSGHVNLETGEISVEAGVPKS